MTRSASPPSFNFICTMHLTWVQMFDLLVDNEGHYLLGGHTTVGTAENSGTGVAVVNWDYLAIKVNSQTKQVEWRKTFGQPRGFDAR